MPRLKQLKRRLKVAAFASATFVILSPASAMAADPKKDPCALTKEVMPKLKEIVTQVVNLGGAAGPWIVAGLLILLVFLAGNTARKWILEHIGVIAIAMLFAAIAVGLFGALYGSTC